MTYFLFFFKNIKNNRLEFKKISGMCFVQMQTENKMMTKWEKHYVSYDTI